MLMSVILLFLLKPYSIHSKTLDDSNERINLLIKEIFIIPPNEVPIRLIPDNYTDDDEETDNICNSGKCVPFHLCVNNTVLRDGEGLLNVRFQDDADDESRICDSMEKCCTIRNEEKKANKPRRECGHRNANLLQNRITGAGTAEYTEFPWMIAVFQKLKNSNKFRYQCGGSLIHPSVVLTAAHCVATVDANILKIRAGEWDTQNTNEKWPHQDRDIKMVVINEHYYRQALHNDIALLFLDEPVVYGENINSVCLPPQNYNFDANRCFVSGWGKNDYGKLGNFQTTLKKVEIPIVPRKLCQTLLRRTILGKYFRLHKSVICAGGEFGKDACSGDGGSPLVCQVPGSENAYYQAGIVAWGIGCKNSDIPGAYVNVAGFRRWIDRQFQMKNMNNKYYTKNRLFH